MTTSYCLSLLPRVWSRDVRRLAGTGNLGIARLTRNFSARRRELIARRLEVLPAGTRHDRFGPRDDLLLVRLDAQLEPVAARELIARFAALPTQLVVALALGTDQSAGRWTGLVWAGGQALPLGEITLVGPGMQRIFIEEPAEEPSPIDAELWSRTRGALGEAPHRTVRRSSVAVIGAGRNGSACALSLAMLGVRHLVLIDHDLDELGNLDATIGATPSGIGRPKVENRLRTLRRIRSGGLAVTPVARSVFDGAVLEHLRGVDLIVTAVDQDAARLAVARWINRPPYLGKLHLDIGTGVFREAGRREMGADVRLLLPGEACIGCLGGLRDPDEARYVAGAPPGALPRRPRQAWHEGRAGSLVTINQVAVNLGIQLWLDLVAGRVRESRWYQVRWAEDGEPTIQSGGQPADACEICRRGENS